MLRYAESFYSRSRRRQRDVNQRATVIVLPDSAVVLVAGMTVLRGKRRKKLWIINWILTCPDPSEL